MYECTLYVVKINVHYILPHVSLFFIINKKRKLQLHFFLFFIRKLLDMSIGMKIGEKNKRKDFHLEQMIIFSTIIHVF